MPLVSVSCKVFCILVVFDGDKTDQVRFTGERWGLIVKCCVDKLLGSKQK